MSLTPFRWTTNEGLTHIFYDNGVPPSKGFGWSSLCNELQLPIEGEHFELNKNVTEGDITCSMCKDVVERSSLNLNEDSIAAQNGCLFRLEWDESNVITRAQRVCRNAKLHHLLSFEPDSFSGNLEEQVENVCSECWEIYVDRQWSSVVEVSELRVELYEADPRSEYFAARAETFRRGGGGQLRLVSENELEKYVSREEIKSITLTPHQNVNY